MSAPTLVTIVLMVVLPSILVFVGAMQGGGDAVPFNMAATALLVLGTAVHLLAHIGD